MKNKTFKSLDEQIKILENKGLVIDNIDYAKEVLLRENYFFLNGYRHPFMKSQDRSRYIEGTKFEEVYSLFLFDRKLRNILFKNILIIENNIKSIISYQLSKKYGYREKEYLKTSNFNTSFEYRKQVNDLIGKMKRQIKTNAVQHSATRHYVINYGYIPLWVLVKVLSFGIVVELFSALKKEDQYDIMEFYGLDLRIFITNLSILSNYRNLCAHEDIVYENKTQKYIEDSIYHRKLKISMMDNEYIYGKNDLFALIIILKTMLKDNEINDLVNEIDNAIENLEYNLRTIPINKILDRMGFPDNWKDISNIHKREMFWWKNL